MNNSSKPNPSAVRTAGRKFAFWALACLLPVAAGLPQAAAGPIPFPEALEAAAITQPSIDDLDRKAMIVGNGDINALIFSRGNELIMQVAKNDVWDARLDTAKDGPLLKVDVAKRTWEGGVRPPSWEKPYPTQTPPCVISIPLDGKIVGTKLDLRRGVALIKTTNGLITIRALAQANVFYIETDGEVSLKGFPQRFLPAAEIEINGTITSVKQTLPGDLDYGGMEVYAVKESKGKRHAISVTNSRKFEEPLEEAKRLTSNELSTESVKVVQAHETEWAKYWSRSGVELADEDFQNWWYRQLYYFRCLSRPGSQAIALQGGYNSKANWHGTWTVNYNAQQSFWVAFSSNHPELAEPFIDLANDFHPRARWYAKTVFGCEGAATPHNLWPFEPDPAVCKSVNKRQLAYMPWSYGVGTVGHVGHILWLHYSYTGNKAYLKDKIYPVLRDYAIFYASFAEQCAEKNGKLAFGPSVDPEHTRFGINNSPYDLAWARHTLRAAIQAAKDLKVDGKLVTRWNATLDKLPDYPRSGAAGKDIFQVPGVGNYNLTTPVVPLFPAEQASWFSPEDEKERFKRTIRWIQDRYNRNNSVVILNVARARLSMTEEAHADTKTWFKEKEQPNGLFFWKAHGYYMSEQTAVAGLINEFLMQSVDDIVRVFPAFPKNQDAQFSGLRAKGGFLVSAEQNKGEVVQLEVTSTAGGKLQILSPWPTITVHPKDDPQKRTTLKADERGVIALQTRTGQELVFKKGR